jgi:serine/threonine-protein kinase
MAQPTEQTALQERTVEHTTPVFLGRYCLIDRVSKGGMSNIYLAKSTGFGGFQRPLIIKKLLTEYSKTKRHVTRFINEGKTLSMLNHSNIVQVIDMGMIESQYFIAMEYIEGRNAAHVISRAKSNGVRLPLELAAHILLETAKGLSYAHKKKDSAGQNLQLIHQDLNCFNVMVSYEGEVKVIDFGIARKFLDAPQNKETPVAGKLIYFSPEQLQNKNVDRRVDIYGAGVLLYELITGERLVNHQETVAQTVKLILEMDAKEKVEQDPKIPDALKPLLFKTVAADPDERYSSMDELMEELRKVISDLSLELDTTEFAEFMQTQFRTEMGRDRRRLRKLLASGALGDGLRTGGASSSTSLKRRGLLAAFMRQSDLGSGLEEDQEPPQQDVLPRSISFPEGRRIYDQGDLGTNLYLIQSGRIRIFIRSGATEQTIETLTTGDMFGETALLNPAIRVTAAEALDDCHLMVIPREAFRSLVSEDLARKIVTRMAEKLRDANGLIECGMLDDSLTRFIFSLVYYFRKAPNLEEFEVDFAEIEELFGITRDPQIEKYLEKLVMLEVLEKTSESVLLKDFEKLTNILEILTSSGRLTLKF